MNRAIFHRRLRQLHLWLGLAIGAQVGLWLVSGLFMVWFPIEEVRGEHLRGEAASERLDWSSDYLDPAAAIGASDIVVETLSARHISGIPVWRAEGYGKTVLIHAESGEIISPLNERIATTLAHDLYRGRGELTSAFLLDEPPREYGRSGPVWRVEFTGRDAATFYVDASTGEVRAVRTGLWRAFDFMWGLHIMDWSSRENFNSWWLKMTASLAVLFFIAGLGLIILRLSGMIQRGGRN